MDSIQVILNSRGIQLKSKNKKDYLILCPFHEDTNASCSVDKEKGFFHCWSCGEKGSIAKLISRIDRIDEKDAWKILNGEETSQKIIHHKKEEVKKSKEDPLVEKYYECKELMMLLFSRKDLRLGKELNKELKENSVWEEFRKKQKQLKENWKAEDTIKEAKFLYITDDIECYYKEKLYQKLVEAVKEYKFQQQFNLVIKLIETQEYKNYMLEKKIIKEAEKRIYSRVKSKLKTTLDEFFV